MSHNESSMTPDALSELSSSFSSHDLAYQTPAGLGMLQGGDSWRLPDHLVRLNQELMEMAAGRTKRLLILMPPGHSKSTTVNDFVAWHMGRFPDKRIILVSYEGNYAAGWGRRSRNILEEYGRDVFDVEIDSRSSAGHWWQLEGHKGTLWTSGVGGALTGKRVEGLVIDDPVKNARDANSQATRDSVWEWYLSTASTRLEPGAWQIVILTRWHEDDMGGRILKLHEQGHEEWKVMKFPALAGEDDPLGRAPGEALWPERYPEEYLRERKIVLGSYWFEALYQQDPSPQDGAVFKEANMRWFRVEDREDGQYVVLGVGENDAETPPVVYRMEDCWMFTTADLASSMKTSADYFCACVWIVTPKHDLCLAHVVRKRLQGPDQLETIRALDATWHPKVTCIESVQYQETLVQHARRKGLAAQSVHVHKDKFSRAQGPAARMEAGTIFFLEGAVWMPDLVKELVAFPNGSHDDQVDNLSMASEKISRGGGMEAGSSGLVYLGAMAKARAERKAQGLEVRKGRGTKDWLAIATKPGLWSNPANARGKKDPHAPSSIAQSLGRFSSAARRTKWVPGDPEGRGGEAGGERSDRGSVRGDGPAGAGGSSAS